MSKIAISLKPPILFQSTNPTAQIELQVLAGVPRNCTECYVHLLDFWHLLASIVLTWVKFWQERESLLVFLRLSSGLPAPHAGPALRIGLAIKWESAIKRQQYGSKGIEHELILQPLARKGLQCFGHYIQSALQKEVSLEWLLFCSF